MVFPFCHPSACIESYTVGLTVVSLQTYGILLTVLWSAQGESSSVNPRESFLMDNEKQKTGEKFLGKSLQLFDWVAFLWRKYICCGLLGFMCE